MLTSALLLQAAAAAPIFAPPLGVPLLVRTERTESGLANRRFTLEREVRFAREQGGYRVEVRVLAAHNDAAAPLDGMLEAGFASLIGQPVVVHVRADGTLLAIDDMSALWSRFAEDMGRIAARRQAGSPAQRDASARRFSTPLRALPPDRQRAALGSLATAIIPEEPPEPAGTRRPISLPGTSPFGGAVLLTGTKETRLAGGATESVIRATAPVAGHGPTARTGGVRLERRVRTDRVTGLIAASDETTRIDAGSHATLRVVTVRVVAQGSIQPN